jgi:ribokinase
MTPIPSRICVVGSANIDLTFRTARLPAPGETLTGHGFQLGFGGKGANQAVMAARLGARVTMIGTVGRDVFGEQTLANLQAEGIDTRCVHAVAGQPTGVASIVVNDAAQNCIIVVPGANAHLTPADIEAAADAIVNADALVAQLEVPLDTTLTAFRLARAAGVRNILNPAPAASVPDALLQLADLCVPNEPEIEQLTGQAAATPEQAEHAARLLQQRGPRTVIVTLGRRGALVLADGVAEIVPGLSVNAVDTTGAGDAFIGSLAVFLAEGMGLGDAVRKSNAAAALSVTRPGAQTSFPRRAQIETFLESRRGE